MSNPHDINEKERDLFRQRMADTKPLRQDKVLLKAPTPAPEPKQRQRDEQEVLEELSRGPLDMSEHSTGEDVVYACASADRSTLRRLRKGQYSIEAQLDLHGLTTEKAEPALQKFIAASLEGGLRCVRVIHGKGNRSPGKTPVLKGLVHRKLRRNNNILAFCSAPPNDGGSGAIYVLLRRRR